MSDLLTPLRAAPARAAVLTDFDGTLSPIVADWTAASPLDGTRDVLDALADRYAVVAVISGRPVSYLADQLGTRLQLSGLYGLETMIDGVRIPAEGAERWRDAVGAAFESATARFGSIAEDKGLSMTVHFRTRPEITDAVLRWATAQAERTGLELRTAKASVELHPPVLFDKGTVVERAARGLDAACFFGDDVGDLPAFAALDRLRDDGMHTVKVGVRTAEAPPVLVESADLHVDGPAGALELLRTL